MRLRRRQRLAGGFLGLAFDPCDRRLRLGVAAARRQPARRFRQQPLQDHGDEGRQRADDEHPLPAEARHDPRADEAGRNQADRKHQFVEQDEAAAALGARQLADIGRRDRNLAAQAETLDDARADERVVIPGEGAGETHDGKDQDRPDHRRDAAVALRDPAEEQRAGELTEIAGRDQEADLRTVQLPRRHQHRQHEGDGERVEGVEERRDADDDPRLDVPPRDRQPLDPRDNVADRSAGAVGAHRPLPASVPPLGEQGGGVTLAPRQRRRHSRILEPFAAPQGDG